MTVPPVPSGIALDGFPRLSDRALGIGVANLLGVAWTVVFPPRPTPQLTPLRGPGLRAHLRARALSRRRPAFPPLRLMLRRRRAMRRSHRGRSDIALLT